MIDPAAFGTYSGQISDLGKVLAVLAMLALFAIVYNHWVGEQGRTGKAEGMTSLHVAAGVAFTLFGLALLWWQAALLALLCFVASGAPMIYGSLNRYLELRAKSQKGIVDDTAQTLAERGPLAVAPSPESV